RRRVRATVGAAGTPGAVRARDGRAPPTDDRRRERRPLGLLAGRYRRGRAGRGLQRADVADRGTAGNPRRRGGRGPGFPVRTPAGTAEVRSDGEMGEISLLSPPKPHSAIASEHKSHGATRRFVYTSRASVYTNRADSHPRK